MPRFFFNIDDGTGTLPDTIGTELADFAAARSEAIRAAGEMLADIDGALKGRWEMTVVDETGKVVLRLQFFLVEEVAS